MDPATGLTILGGAIGGAKVVEKLLGPTSDYVGQGLRSWTERRVTNASRIFRIAADKLGGKIDEPGEVSPRVLKEVLDEGSYCDDDLLLEYFGGVLASSRSGTSRDDRGASYLKLTSELSAYQVRFHYLCYSTFRALFVGSGLRPTFFDDLSKMWLFLPASFLQSGMDFAKDEPSGVILMHCTSGLSRHSLIEYAHWGKPDHVNPLNKKNGWCEITESGVTVAPTQYGIDYWLWGMGVGHVSRGDFLSAELELTFAPEIVVPDNAIKLVSQGDPGV